MIPNMTNLHLNLFEDADFAGWFISEDKNEPISVKSRTGILLKIGDIPIL